jgi:hypothetical protein
MPKYEFYVIEKWTDTIEIEAEDQDEAEAKAEEYLEDRDMGRAVIDCYVEFNGEIEE